MEQIIGTERVAKQPFDKLSNTPQKFRSLREGYAEESLTHAGAIAFQRWRR
jgi:hypothetical protein